MVAFRGIESLYRLFLIINGSYRLSFRLYIIFLLDGWDGVLLTYDLEARILELELELELNESANKLEGIKDLVSSL